jgi:hypothetical protein
VCAQLFAVLVYLSLLLSPAVSQAAALASDVISAGLSQAQGGVHITDFIILVCVT